VIFKVYCCFTIFLGLQISNPIVFLLFVLILFSIILLNFFSLFALFLCRQAHFPFSSSLTFCIFFFFPIHLSLFLPYSTAFIPIFSFFIFFPLLFFSYFFSVLINHSIIFGAIVLENNKRDRAIVRETSIERKRKNKRDTEKRKGERRRVLHTNLRQSKDFSPLIVLI
jgi:hypothetical protein